MLGCMKAMFWDVKQMKIGAVTANVSPVPMSSSAVDTSLAHQHEESHAARQQHTGQLDMSKQMWLNLNNTSTCCKDKTWNKKASHSLKASHWVRVIATKMTYHQGIVALDMGQLEQSAVLLLADTPECAQHARLHMPAQ